MLLVVKAGDGVFVPLHEVTGLPLYDGSSKADRALYAPQPATSSCMLLTAVHILRQTYHFFIGGTSRSTGRQGPGGVRSLDRPSKYRCDGARVSTPRILRLLKKRPVWCPSPLRCCGAMSNRIPETAQKIFTTRNWQAPTPRKATVAPRYRY